MYPSPSLTPSFCVAPFQPGAARLGVPHPHPSRALGSVRVLSGLGTRTNPQRDRVLAGSSFVLRPLKDTPLGGSVRPLRPRQ